MRTHITIVHKEFTLETLCRENQQIEELYYSYYIKKLFKVITTTIVDNSHHHRLVQHNIIYIDAKQHGSNGPSQLPRA